MKPKSILHRWLSAALTGLGTSAILLAGSSQCQAQDIPVTNVINTFDSAGAYGGGIGTEWGTGSAAWDGQDGNPAGAELITVVWGPASDTPITAYACNGDGPNPWYNPNPISFSHYQTLEFDIKYDNTSDITIDQFNNVATWPFSLTNSVSGGQSVFQSWATTGGAALAADGAIGGLEINLCGGPAGQMGPVIINTNMPYAASNGWTHVIIPINQSQANIDGVSGIVFHRWCKDTWTLQTNVTARFWIDNVVLKGTTAAPPPPTLTTPTRPVQGLNIFASTMGNSYYDRQEVVSVTNTDLSWVGRATSANPVTYSFTIVGYPNSVNCEAYMFLTPNATAISSPDWNATNNVIAYIQGDATNATMRFQYKVNEANQQMMYSGTDPYTNAPGSWDGVSAGHLESGNLGSVTNAGVLGTWKVQFTSDTNITLIAPNGNTSSFVMPAYNAGNFADSQNFTIYLGMQANQADGMNKPVVYSAFSVTGVPNAFSDNFMTSLSLNTNIWNKNLAGGPAGVLVIPSEAAASGWWVSHGLPDSGFSLQTGSSLTNLLSWTSPTIGPIIPMAGVTRQLVHGSELPAGSTAFFNMIQRTYTQLQVLLPGQTNAPGTVLGYTGTPTPISLATQGLNPTTVTVNACDASWHIINGVSDTIHLTSSDTSAYLPPNMAMVNGVASFTGANGVLFQSTGSITVTAADVTSATVTNTATSAAVTIGN